MVKRKMASVGAARASLVTLWRCYLGASTDGITLSWWLLCPPSVGSNLDILVSILLLRGNRRMRLMAPKCASELEEDGRPG